MEHSNKQYEREAEYARLNKEYIDDKRDQLQDFKERDKKRPKKSRFYCCLVILTIVGLSCYVIYYFITSIKGDLINDYYQRKEQVENVLPQAREELQTGLEQGGQLLEQTQETVESAQDKYEKARETIKKAEDIYDKVEAVVR